MADLWAEQVPSAGRGGVEVLDGAARALGVVKNHRAKKRSPLHWERSECHTEEFSYFSSKQRRRSSISKEVAGSQ